MGRKRYLIRLIQGGEPEIRSGIAWQQFTGPRSFPQHLHWQGSKDQTNREPRGQAQEPVWRPPHPEPHCQAYDRIRKSAHGKDLKDERHVQQIIPNRLLPPAEDLP